MTGRAIYSSRLDAFRQVCPKPEIYLAPKARLPALRGVVKCPLIALEDVDKTNTWLWLNEVVNESTRVVYDRVSRYYKVGLDKARKLSRLAEMSQVSLVDIVPFCEHRKFLYMPWRYVSRSILGYAHYYAFSGDHGEEIDGRIVNSLDESLLCQKIAPHVVSCEPRTQSKRTLLQLAFTEDEQQHYLAKREQLFAKYKTPQPILTRLADLSHGFATRKNAIRKLIDERTAVICNLASFTKAYPGAKVGTYAKPPPLSKCSRIVFAEPPIVTTYKRLDIESQLVPGTEIIDVVGDVKVDGFLHGRVTDELQQIDHFMERLRESLQKQKRP